MKKLIIVFVLFIISTLLFLTNKEFFDLPFDASKNRGYCQLFIKVNSKTKSLYFSHGYDGNKNNKSIRLMPI